MGLGVQISLTARERQGTSGHGTGQRSCARVVWAEVGVGGMTPSVEGVAYGNVLPLTSYPGE